MALEETFFRIHNKDHIKIAFSAVKPSSKGAENNRLYYSMALEKRGQH